MASQASAVERDAVRAAMAKNQLKNELSFFKHVDRLSTAQSSQSERGLPSPLPTKSYESHANMVAHAVQTCGYTKNSTITIICTTIWPGGVMPDGVIPIILYFFFVYIFLKCLNRFLRSNKSAWGRYKNRFAYITLPNDLKFQS